MSKKVKKKKSLKIILDNVPEKTPAINGLAERQTVVKSLFLYLIGAYRVFVVK